VVCERVRSKLLQQVRVLLGGQLGEQRCKWQHPADGPQQRPADAEMHNPPTTWRFERLLRLALCFGSRAHMRQQAADRVHVLGTQL
jgi:hypothetical protein